MRRTVSSISAWRPTKPIAAKLLQEPGRLLDVREEKGDRPGR